MFSLLQSVRLDIHLSKKMGEEERDFQTNKMNFPEVFSFTSTIFHFTFRKKISNFFIFSIFFPSSQFDFWRQKRRVSYQFHCWISPHAFYCMPKTEIRICIEKHQLRQDANFARAFLNFGFEDTTKYGRKSHATYLPQIRDLFNKF